MGYIPNEYRLFRAARYTGVPPWELEQVSSYWMNTAQAFESIEAEAERKLRERQSKARKRKSA